MHDRIRRWWRTRHLTEGQVVAERTHPKGTVAKLVWRNGRLECLCPYACLATYEPCEFSDKTKTEWLTESRAKGEPPSQLEVDTDHWCNDTGIA